jgi:integrase
LELAGRCELAKRRSKGEGTVYQRSDNLWEAQITLPDHKRITKYGKSQKEVREWLLLKRRELSDGTLADDERMTVSVFLDKWYEVAKPRLRPSTQTVHEVMIRLHIKPQIGHIRLSQLTPVHLQNLYSEKLKEGLSNRSVKYIHTIIHQMLNQAVRWGMLHKNVSDAVTSPIPVRKPVEPLTQAQVRSLLEVLKDDRLYPLFVIYLATGLRRGEALALKWVNTDLANGIIYVKGTLQNVKGMGVVLGEPKTESARRVVALPAFAQTVLIDHKLRQTVESEFVFCTSKGTPFSPRNVLRHFKTVVKKAGLPENTTIHSLRHFFVSYALAQHIPPRDIQGIIGHADFSTTMSVYGHMMQGAQKEAADKMNKLFTA